MLVPHESIEGLREKLSGSPDLASTILWSGKTVQTHGTAESRLDEEMRDILDGSADDREKWGKFSQILDRYLLLKKNASRKHAISYDDDGVAEGSRTSSHQQDVEQKGHHPERITAEEEEFQDRVIDSLPISYQGKGLRLLRFLREVANSHWDAQGRVSIDGTDIQGANLTDLIHNALRTRRKPPPAGYEEFAATLRKYSVPQEYISNKGFWDQARPASGVDSPLIPSQASRADQPLITSQASASGSEISPQTALETQDENKSPEASNTNGTNRQQKKKPYRGGGRRNWHRYTSYTRSQD